VVGNGPSSIKRVPESVILKPQQNVSIRVGQALSFSGLGVDHNGDSQLRYLWNFQGATLNSAKANPGVVFFNKKGTFDVNLTVTDSLGLVSKPAVVTVTVR